MQTIDELKALIIEAEVVENVLIEYGNTYDVVTCSVVDYDEDSGYSFYVEGYSCAYDIDALDDWRLVSECFS